MRKSILGIALIMCAAMVVFQSCGKGEKGIINGEFSVSPTQKVKFSKGNLQYNSTTKEWKFAEFQWDVLGSKNNALDDQGDSFKGIVDLFFYGSADNALMNEGDDPKYSEWGKNPIVNASNIPDEWRTLSAKEYEYLIKDRPNAMSLMYPATIESIYGIVLLPDDFKDIEGAKIYRMKETDYKSRSYTVDFANGDSIFEANKYTKEEFMKIEMYGAVFLPFGGEHFFKVEDNKVGSYWSTGNENGASYLSMYKNSVWPDRGCVNNCFRFSVRLVKDVINK